MKHRKQIVSIVVIAVITAVICLSAVMHHSGNKTADNKESYTGSSEESTEASSDTGQDLSDAIRGMDISSYIAIQDSFDALNEEAGETKYGYRNDDGEIIKDQEFFDFLASKDLNWVRIRIWNDPYDADGNGYGGGNNDLDKAVKMGQWATNAGMRVLIDLHYSDFWADPNKQNSPKAWENMNLDERVDAVSEYTTETVQKLIDSGVDVGMVQIGNETNGAVCGVTGGSDWTDTIDRIFDAGCDAVHSVENTVNQDGDTNILTAVHFANPEAAGQEAGFADQLADYVDDNGDEGVSYDVFASSYYPYWHGSLSNLQDVLGSIAEKYDKKVMVAETSYANTLTDTDGHANTVAYGSNDTGNDLLWDFSQKGQAEEYHDVLTTVMDTTGGIGAFYWEGAWISVQDISGYDEGSDEYKKILKENKALWEKYGSGWAASYAGKYDPDDAGKWYGGSAVDNQCFFDAEGNPLASFAGFDPDFNADSITESENAVRIYTTPVEIESGSTLSESDLPDVGVEFDDGSYKRVTPEYDANDISAVNEAAQSSENAGKEYKIKCTYDGASGECTVSIAGINLISNPGFESGTDSWTLDKGNISSDGHLKVTTETPEEGDSSLHFWSSTAFEFSFSTTVTVDAAGTYKSSIDVQGGYGETDKSQDGYVVMTVTAGGKTYTSDNVTLQGWKVWTPVAVSDIEITDDMIASGDNEVTITVSACNMGDGAWGSFDSADFSVSK